MSLVQVKFTFDGKRYSVYGHTKQEAEQKAFVKRALLEAKVRELQKSYTVEQWAHLWLDEYKRGVVSESWYRDMQSIIDSAICPIIGHRAMKSIKPMDIIKVLNKCSHKSKSYCDKVLLILRQIFSEAEYNDIILKDPTKRVKVQRSKEPHEKRPLTDHERSLAIKTALKHPDDGRLFMIMLFCGCRPQEVAVLTRADFDLESKVLTIDKALKRDGEVGAPKSKAGYREIPIPDALLPFIPEHDGLVCTNTLGEPLTKSSIRDMWQRYKREMDIENGAVTFRNAIVKSTIADDLTPYCFRHTYCTDLQDKGVPLAVASRLMGHASLELTAKIYTHKSDSSFAEALDRLNT